MSEDPQCPVDRPDQGPKEDRARKGSAGANRGKSGLPEREMAIGGAQESQFAVHLEQPLLIERIVAKNGTDVAERDAEGLSL